LNIDDKKFRHCKKCIKDKNLYKHDCDKCPASEILDNLKILTDDQTLDEIINNNKSISRFGDGEFDIMFDRKIKFQKSDKLLSKRLKSVFISDEENLLLGVDDSLNSSFLKNFKNPTFFVNWRNSNMYNLLKVLNVNKTYASTRISRFYIDYINNDDTPEYVKKLRKVWEKKDIVIIEGEKSRLGIGNDLFNNTNSIQRIICPSENAFDSYDKIMEESLKLDKNKLVLIALGPTATVLAYDLYKNGYQAIDIGHVDLEYEWFLRNATRRTKIEYKYVNEIRGGNLNIQNVTDENYFKQIIAKILN
jgi:glycosyltransferase family protein